MIGLWGRLGSAAGFSNAQIYLYFVLYSYYLFIIFFTTETVPIVTITNQSQEIIILQGSNTVLQFTCSATGQPTPNLTWVRGGENIFMFPENDPRITLTNIPPALVLTIMVSLEDSGTLASEEGIPYFCLASNVLGTARSRAVMLRYPGK